MTLPCAHAWRPCCPRLPARLLLEPSPRLAHLPLRFCCFRCAFGSRCRAAYWPSCSDCLPTIRARAPLAAAGLVRAFSSTEIAALFAAARRTAGRLLRAGLRRSRLGFHAAPAARARTTGVRRHFCEAGSIERPYKLAMTRARLSRIFLTVMLHLERSCRRRPGHMQCGPTRSCQPLRS